MDKSKLKEQVDVIREAFTYINHFKNDTFVIHLDSSLLAHSLFPLLIKDIVLLHKMGIRIALVPGAKIRIDEVLSTYKISWKTVQGVRISSEEAIPFIKMAAFDVSNTIMTMLAENNTDAIVGNWVRARGIGVRNGIDFQSSGSVDKLKTEIIQNVLEQKMVPIFPNIGWNTNGKPYNISSTELAFTLAAQLQAAKLFFITDCGGIKASAFKVLPDVYIASDGIVSQLTLEEAQKILQSNPQKDSGPSLHHRELLSLAYRACNAGVQRVHIVNGLVEGMVLKEIFSNRGLGTMVYANQHDNIRPMSYADIPDVIRIMQPLIESGTLVTRSAEDLEKQLNDFVVYDVDGTIHGCAALHLFKNNSAEIAGVAVDDLYASLGIGRKMISYFLERAHKEKLAYVFVLTTQTADWFVGLGFKESQSSALPPQRRKTYNPARNSQVLVYRVGSRRKITRIIAVD